MIFALDHFAKFAVRREIRAAMERLQAELNDARDVQERALEGVTAPEVASGKSVQRFSPTLESRLQVGLEGKNRNLATRRAHS